MHTYVTTNDSKPIYWFFGVILFLPLVLILCPPFFLCDFILPVSDLVLLDNRQLKVRELVDTKGIKKCCTLNMD